jgi:hypothetical protein
MDTSDRKQSLALESWRALRILSEFVDGVAVSYTHLTLPTSP